MPDIEAICSNVLARLKELELTVKRLQEAVAAQPGQQEAREPQEDC